MQSDVDHNGAPFSGFQKLFLLIGAIACYGAWYFIGTTVGLPTVPHFSTSILQSNATLNLVTLAVGIPLLSAIISLLVGRTRVEAGLFCCLIGLACIPARSGDIRSILLQADSQAVYLTMLTEIIFLGVIIAASYELLNKLAAFGLLAAPAVAPKDDPDTLGDRVTVLIAQALCTMLLMMFLGQSPVKGQAMASVCAAALVSSLAIHQTYRVRGSIWYILGTLLAGAVAYTFTYFNPAGMPIGDVRGTLAGAARSLPLHYASMGVAGAIFGYWTSLHWHAARNPINTDDARSKAAA